MHKAKQRPARRCCARPIVCVTVSLQFLYNLSVFNIFSAHAYIAQAKHSWPIVPWPSEMSPVLAPPFPLEEATASGRRVLPPAVHTAPYVLRARLGARCRMYSTPLGAECSRKCSERREQSRATRYEHLLTPLTSPPWKTDFPHVAFGNKYGRMPVGCLDPLRSIFPRFHASRSSSVYL